MEANAYLNFNGDANDAIKYYEQHLGAKTLHVMTHGNSPMAEHAQPGWEDKVMHAALQVGSSTVLISDSPAEWYKKPQGLYVTLTVDTPEDADRIFAALADGGEVSMAIEETFWAKRFGIVTDKFGIPWMVNCNKPM